jgi:hypothetical protein
MCLLSGRLHYCTQETCCFYYPEGRSEDQLACSISGVVHAHEELEQSYYKDSVDITETERMRTDDNRYQTASDLLNEYKNGTQLQRGAFEKPHMQEAKVIKKHNNQHRKKMRAFKEGKTTTDINPFYEDNTNRFLYWVNSVQGFICAALNEPLTESVKWINLANHCVQIWRCILNSQKFTSRAFGNQKLKGKSTKDIYPLIYHALIMLVNISEGGRTVVYTDPQLKTKCYYPLYKADKSIKLPSFADMKERLSRANYNVDNASYNTALTVFSSCISEAVVAHERINDPKKEEGLRGSSSSSSSS